MPLYDYRCHECNHHFEEFQKIDDRYVPLDRACPKCNKKTLVLVIGAPAICDSVRIGVKKHDKGWEETLAKVKEKTGVRKIPRKF